MTNRWVGVGRLTRDVDLKFTAQGLAVASFTVAINRPYKNQQTGEYDADFINCVAFRKLAENVANYTKKGDLICVDGRIQTRSYENNQGKKVYVTEVVAENVQFLQTKKQEAQKQEQQQSVTDPFQDTDFGNIDLNDDDLPF